MPHNLGAPIVGIVPGGTQDPVSGGNHPRHLLWRGSWVSTAVGKVAPFRDAPNDGEGSGMHLNGEITAASPS